MSLLGGATHKLLKFVKDFTKKILEKSVGTDVLKGVKILDNNL